jgi:transposase
MAADVIAINAQIKHVDNLISGRFHRHELGEVIESMPGIGVLLGAEFLAGTGGDMTISGSAARPAAYAGLAPAPRDSGQVTGSLHRPRRYNRTLQRVFYASAQISIRFSPDSKAFYDRKLTEGKHHTPAVLALARRCYEPAPPLSAAA